MDSFDFTKNWNSPTDFPTIETSEAQVRADMQYQPDELKDFLNGHVVPAVNGLQSETKSLKVSNLDPSAVETAAEGISNRDDAFPTSAAVLAQVRKIGAGDMMEATYDPRHKRKDVFADIEAVSVKVDTLETTVDTMGANVSSLSRSVSSAQATANTAKSTADTAKSTADTAQSTANSANTKAQSALTTAGTANTNATNALSKANDAKSTADSAKSTATTAKSTADSAKSIANTAKSTAEAASHFEYYRRRIKSDGSIDSSHGGWTTLYLNWLSTSSGGFPCAKTSKDNWNFEFNTRYYPATKLSFCSVYIILPTSAIAANDYTIMQVNDAAMWPVIGTPLACRSYTAPDAQAYIDTSGNIHVAFPTGKPKTSDTVSFRVGGSWMAAGGN